MTLYIYALEADEQPRMVSTLSGMDSNSFYTFDRHKLFTTLIYHACQMNLIKLK